MASLAVVIKATLPSDANGDSVVAPAGLQAIVSYSRIIRAGGTDANNKEIPDEVGPKDRQLSLSEKLTAESVLQDYSAGTKVSIAVTDDQGARLVSFRDQMPTESRDSTQWLVTVEIGEEIARRIIDNSTPNRPQRTRVLSAKAEFRPTIEKKIYYKDYSLVVTTVNASNLDTEKKQKYFGSGTASVSSSSLTLGVNTLLSDIGAASISSVDLNLQGQFDFTMQSQEGDDSWVWVLSGPYSFAGIVKHAPDDRTIRRVLWLPFDTESLDEHQEIEEAADHNSNLPVDASEQEILNSPELFSDDPGTRCKPFSSPHRIVGERTFHTVLRVTQPELSSDAQAPQPPGPRDLLTRYEIDESEFSYVATAMNSTDPSGTGARGGSPMRGRLANLSNAVVSNLAAATNAITSLVVSNGNSLTASDSILAEARAEILRQPQGRRLLTSDMFLDWEDDTPPQAASLSYGHILEYRVRWRNNGYSLGDVLYSLPLAPRQTKQIVTVTSSIVDSARRQESVTATEEIAQGTTRDYGYTDAVQAGLSEWAKGGSKASQTGAAGGFGLAIGPVVLGGGASHGQAQSSSWQQGGRNVSAIEQQSLRDAIRQYGESVRKLETVVIQEQSQEETTQAVSEVVRNPNYCHTLTVVYHEILRHLRVDTEVVGARECIFVPLPIRPFTINRMIRWRDSLTRVLMRPRLRWVMPYLEDVRDEFPPSSEIPPGRRADQPISYLSGSIYLRVAIERPQDPEDEDVFEKARWIALSPFVNRPIREIFERLRRNRDQKDQIFQKEYAPSIARRWIDKLIIKVNGVPLDGVDMTLSSKYRYGETVRVDFTCAPQELLRRSDITVPNIVGNADFPLTVGSIANVERVFVRYTTNDFSREVRSNRASMDLIDVDTGDIEAAGAQISLPLTDWEKKNQQEIIKAQVELLKKHINEHLEHYHKHLWWNMDRDKLYLLLDSIYAISQEDGRSVASVVERNPIAILGNNLVYKVAGGAHLGINGHTTSEDLNDYYVDSVTSGEPIRVSLPTSGVYAQALLDDCEACEEHFGSTEWILDDKEQELASIDPSLLRSRRADTPELTPSELPASIINLQNAPSAPSPSGLSGTLDALTKSGAFGDMAGLEGTQANSKAAMDAAAKLATDFGAKALDLEKTKIAAKVAKEKLAMIKKAEEKGQITPEKAKSAASKTIDQSLQKEDKEIPSDKDGLVDMAREANRHGVEISARKGSRQLSVKPVKKRTATKAPDKSSDGMFIDFGTGPDDETIPLSVDNLIVETVDLLIAEAGLVADNWSDALDSVTRTLEANDLVVQDRVDVLGIIASSAAAFLPGAALSVFDKLVKANPLFGDWNKTGTPSNQTYRFVKSLFGELETASKALLKANISQSVAVWLNSEQALLNDYRAKNIDKTPLLEEYRLAFLEADKSDRAQFYSDLSEIKISLQTPGTWPRRSMGQFERQYYEAFINMHRKTSGDINDAKGAIQYRFRLNDPDSTDDITVLTKTVVGPGGVNLKNAINSLINRGVIKSALDMRVYKQVVVEREVVGPNPDYAGWMNEKNVFVTLPSQLVVISFLKNRSAWESFTTRLD